MGENNSQVLNLSVNNILAMGNKTGFSKESMRAGLKESILKNDYS